ncbi:MAG: molybdopterin biosynthesis protein [Anaerolinea sp.]|nr:molybdopterin biosynthesis protein [Anaerolinea sp.]
MSVYLKDIPLEEALKRLNAALLEHSLAGALNAEEIQLTESAAGRVLSEGIWARLCSPHYHAAAMDGFAVNAAHTRDALPSRPLQLRVGEQAFYVDTGDPLPERTNAVIPVENVEPISSIPDIQSDLHHPDAVLIRASVTPWSHVRLLGEDIVATQLVLPAGHVLRPFDLGAVAASGYGSVKVIRKPKVAIIPTGNELVEIGREVKTGDIIEYNSLVMAAQVNDWGGITQRYPIVKDDLDQLREAVLHAASRSDLILLNAGSSAGSEDYSAAVIAELGELLVHGVAVRPGHPVIIGIIRPGLPGIDTPVPIIGVPGYPVSAALTCELFVQPLIRLWSGQKPAAIEEVEATLARKVNSPPGDDDMLRVTLGTVKGRLLAAPLPRGAGVITSLVLADGIVVIPRGVQGLEAGEKVQVRLYRPRQELTDTLLITGSHDLTLDILAEYLAERGHRMVTSNVGSLGGLMALQRGEAHASGSHLLDPDSGVYNDSYIRQYLSAKQVAVMGWVGRVQGLMVKKDNHLNIFGLQDLTRTDVVFSNRQRGAGTRVLLDYHLKQMGIPSDIINGYLDEEYTHLGVAAAVFSGRADCGLGIQAAANALNLDFIPLFEETYELVVPEEHYLSPFFQPVLQAASDPEFKQRVTKLPGYSTARMGEIRFLLKS